MKKHEMEIDFSQMVGEIEQDQILLPDFQRGFEWKDKEIQAKLVASVLCKMPVGSILLLELPGNEYAARRIGSGEQDVPDIAETEEKRQFLLDGQQRITVMVNAFSNLIHEGNGTRLDSLKRRAFLGIANPEQKEQFEKDYWGFRWLYFPLATPDSDIPEFLTEDIFDSIFLEDFTKKNPTAYSPYCDRDDVGLIEYCTSGTGGYYYIPLYLLVDRRDKKLQRSNKALLENIIEAIAERRRAGLEEEYGKFQTEQQKREWLGKFQDNDVVEQLLESDEEFKEYLRNLEREWIRGMMSYLSSCIRKMNLHIMDVPNSSREKAIEIFENMNRGGVKLSTFDLVMARGARDNYRFRQALDEECNQEAVYPLENVPKRIRAYCEKYIEQKRNEKKKYIALRDLDCIKNENDYTKIFQDTFLNVLSLRCNDEKLGEQRNYRDEMSRKSILNLSSKEINANYAECCRALDRAAFFLKARCGVRSITEVNYRLMYTVLSYLFLQETIWKEDRIWDLLTAWYWCVIFAGAYNQDQNTQACRDIQYLTDIIREGKDEFGYIRSFQKEAWEASNFSDKDFLLYRKSDTGNYPKDILGDYICQFYLSEGYEDILRRENEKNINLCTFTENEAGAFEKHHIIPQMSLQSKMEFRNMKEENDWFKKKDARKHVVSSPLNMVYISKNTNKEILSCNYAGYFQYLQMSSICNLDFPDIRPQGNEDGIAELLELRYGKLKGRMNDRVNCWMSGW